MLDSFSETDLAPLVQLCEEGVKHCLFPGAAFAVGTTKSLQVHSIGHITYATDNRQPITEKTLFDLASLTKVIATASVARALVDKGKLNLDEPILERPELSARNLLLHNSGLPPYRNFHLEEPIPKDIRSVILNTPLEAKPGVRVAYSCLGFVLLQQVLERLGREALNKLFARLVANPLGIPTVGFRPIGAAIGGSNSIAPTTEVESWRTDALPNCPVKDGYLHGAVHDPIAYLQGGISGNAGLFGDILSVAKFAQNWLQSLAQTNRDWEVMEDWTRPQAGSRALGWDTWSPGCSAGSKFSKSSFGHTGYTGTSIWIDPENDLFAVLLTNRIHPDDSSSLVEFRPQFHDLSLDLLRGT